MEKNKEHTKIVDDLIYEVFKDDRNGAVVGQMRNAFRKVATAAMGHGFESGYEIGYKSGYNLGFCKGAGSDHSSETNS
jgi:hypothetical protein